MEVAQIRALKKFIDTLITFGETRTHIILSDVASNTKTITSAEVDQVFLFGLLLFMGVQ